MSIYHDEGVVLRTMRLGEADRIVDDAVPFPRKGEGSRQRGEKNDLAFGARLEPLSHVSLLCWQGRELDIVKQAEVIDAYRPVREDLSRVAKAFSMLEVADRISVEGHASPRLYELLVRALGFLAKQDAPLVVPAFFMKVLAVDGSAPMLDACASCGSEGDLVAFSLHEGGALCRDCRRGRAMSPAALQMMRAILEGGLGGVIDEPTGPVTSEVSEIANEAMESHIDRQLRSIRAASGLW